MTTVNDRLCDLSLFIKEMVVLAVPDMSIAMKWGGMRGRELKTMFFAQKREVQEYARTTRDLNW